MIFWFIAAAYAIFSVLLFNHGTHPGEDRIRRLKFAALGMAFMCFGMGIAFRLSGGPLVVWLFGFGHVSFIGFGALYFLAGRQRINEAKAREKRRMFGRFDGRERRTGGPHSMR